MPTLWNLPWLTTPHVNNMSMTVNISFSILAFFPFYHLKAIYAIKSPLLSCKGSNDWSNLVHMHTSVLLDNCHDEIYWNPNSRTCECELLWKFCFCRCHQFQMGSWQRALIQCDLGPYKKRKWSEVAHSCPTLYNPVDCSLPGFVTLWTVAYQAPSSMGFSRQDHWSGLPFPSPVDIPNPGIEPGSSTL